MLRFIFKSILFLLILCAVDFLAKEIIVKAEQVQAGVMGKVNYVMDNFDDDILILGSSRAAHHFNSQMLEDSLGLKTYNAGLDGNGIVAATGLYKNAFRRHIPKLIIYEFSSSYDIGINDNLKYLFNLKPHYDKPYISELFKRVSSVETFKMQSNLYRCNSQILKLIVYLKKKSDRNMKGFYPIEKAMKPSLISDYDLGLNSENHQRDKLKMKLMEELIKECHDNNINLIFSISPVAVKFDNSELEYIKELAKNNNIVLLDHYWDEDFLGHSELFSDRTHLNRNGAKLFTEKIISEIRY